MLKSGDYLVCKKSYTYNKIHETKIYEKYEVCDCYDTMFSIYVPMMPFHLSFSFEKYPIDGYTYYGDYFFKNNKEYRKVKLKRINKC